MKVALDIHKILMLKNKIYKYLSNEILKNFITILLTFTAIAWVVRAVNFLDLMVQDGFSSAIYFKYTALNITTIMTRFVPLSFLISLTISIIKFERQKEFLILWTSGLTKVKVANIFLSIAFFITLFQLILSLFINPFLLDKSRSLLRESGELQYNSVLKSNDFSDTFTGLTFYINEKNNNNELINIFIKDVGGNLGAVISEVGQKKNSTIIAKKGFIDNGKLILFDGMIQTLNQKNEFKNFEFEKTELSLIEASPRVITQPKIQEISSSLLLKCIFSPNNNLNLNNCAKTDYKSVAVQTFLRRAVSPLYIPLISIIVSFLLIYKKEKKYNFLKKYLLFILSFLTLVFAEILLQYTSFSLSIAVSYLVLPIIISIFSYVYFKKKIISEKGYNE